MKRTFTELAEHCVQGIIDESRIETFVKPTVLF